MEDLRIEVEYSMLNPNGKQNRLIEIKQKKSLIFGGTVIG